MDETCLIEGDDTLSVDSTANYLSQPKKVVRIEDISPEAFRFLRSYFYSNKPSLNASIVASVMYASRKMLLDSLHKACVDFIKGLPAMGDLPSFGKAISEAFSFGLKDECLSIFDESKKEWSKIVRSAGFKYLPLPIVETLVASDNLALWENSI